jgi:hypothetical protein
MLRAEDLARDLTAPQRAKLAGIQTDPRARLLLQGGAAPSKAKTSRPRIRDVAANARRDGDAVTVQAKGLALQLTKNQRLHHQEEARIRAHERATIARALEDITPPAGPWLVTIVRQGPTKMDDDNATASAKGVRDAVAAWLKVDDGQTERVRFVVTQLRDKAFGVTITVKGGATW